MKSNKKQIIKFILKNEPVLTQTIADKFYKSDYYKAHVDLKLLQQDDLIMTHEGTSNYIEFFELTIKGKEYLDVFKEKTFRFYLPLVISIFSLIVSTIALLT